MKQLANTINHSRQGKLSPRVPENDERQKNLIAYSVRAQNFLSKKSIGDYQRSSNTMMASYKKTKNTSRVSAIGKYGPND